MSRIVKRTNGYFAEFTKGAGKKRDLRARPRFFVSLFISKILFYFRDDFFAVDLDRLHDIFVRHGSDR